MAASNEWTDWHLTPRGWEQGDSKLDFGAQTGRPIPADRVLTVRYSESMGSTYSKMTRGTEETWRAPDAERVEALLAEHGPCPQAI